MSTIVDWLSEVIEVKLAVTGTEAEDDTTTTPTPASVNPDIYDAHG